jgi:TolC family type I secretion outer membrane protein
VNRKNARKAAAIALPAVFLLCAWFSPCPSFAEEPLGTEPEPAREKPAADEKKTPAEAAGAIGKGETLTLERCVRIALENHPSIIAGTHAVGAAESRIGQARSNYYPQVTLSSGYTRYSSVADPTNTALSQYTGTASLTQSIYEFGRTWNQVTIEQRFRDAARSDLRDTANLVVFNVKGAYYNVIQSQKTVEVLADTVKSFERHLEQAKAFFETGVRSKFDVTKAEVDLSNARLNLIRAENSLRIARVTLNNAMGVPDAPEYGIVDSLPFAKYDVTFEDAVQRAYANRPDLLALLARKEAADESVSLVKKGYLPVLSGTASYIWEESRDFQSETRFWSPGLTEKSGWSAGVTLTFPLFSGFLTSYQLREARENFNVTKANEESLRQVVLLDVQQAYLNLHEAEERVGVNELTVKQAEESYEIAKGRYEAGVGDIIEETDALVALRNARLGLIAAQADYKVAEAALKRAMGEQ